MYFNGPAGPTQTQFYFDDKGVLRKLVPCGNDPHAPSCNSLHELNHGMVRPVSSNQISPKQPIKPAVGGH